MERKKPYSEVIKLEMESVCENDRVHSSQFELSMKQQAEGK